MCAGGETLLSHDILPVIQKLLCEGHYVSVVTNGTLTQRFHEIAGWPEELLRHLFFKFSFHYLELKRREWIDKFFENVYSVRDAGASFTVEITPSDELIPYIDEVKKTCYEYLGTLCHVTIARDDRTDGIDILSCHPLDEYKKIWGQFVSPLFDFKTTIFYKKRKEFCYAGDWSLNLNLETGRVAQCYRCKELDNIYRSPDELLRVGAVGYNCPLPHCYNGHALIALGVIPELEAPTYAEERNRICIDGTEWLQPEMKAFMSSKLYESNKEYSKLRKMMIILKSRVARVSVLKTRVWEILRRIKIWQQD